MFDLAFARAAGISVPEPRCVKILHRDKSDGETIPDELSERLDETRRGVKSLADCFSQLGNLAKSVSRALSSPSPAETKERVSVPLTVPAYPAGIRLNAGVRSTIFFRLIRKR